ncbi:MAG TPA: ABC transporter permease subunit [Streptosporangiaceae bacterium]|nr:ABC transporter permease subunit [Streptosporangiaceae bacterium]
MLRIELITQLRRLRSLLVFGGLAGIVIIAGLTEASKAGGKGGPATFSALNFTESGLNFLDPVLLGLIIALLGSIIGGSDRDWGTLRYLYVRPVSRARMVAGKWWALVVCCVLTMVVYLGFALVTGLLAFGWHPYHRAGVAALSTSTALVGVFEAGGYVLVCLLSIGALALALGLLLPRSAEALGITIAFLVVSAIVDSIKSLHDVVVLLPVHYWQRYTGFFQGGDGGIGVGLVVQAATVVVVLVAAYAILARRDPAA